MNKWKLDRVRIRKGYLVGTPLQQIVALCLPEQGAIELQQDQPRKEHQWHEHQVDETLVLISGSFEFQWCDGKAVCHPGDLIELPCGVPHRSRALENGATYIIALHRINLVT